MKLLTLIPSALSVQEMAISEFQRSSRSFNAGQQHLMFCRSVPIVVWFRQEMRECMYSSPEHC